MFRRTLLSALALTLGCSGRSPASYLFADPDGDFPIPAFAGQSGALKEYSEWDVFYAPHSAGNYPDLAAPHGGTFTNGAWRPVQRSTAGFAAHPVYNPADPLAFWDTKNATIKQVGTTTATILGRTISGNIYSFSDPTGYVLQDSTADAATPYQLGTVQFQFQTDGTLVDFSSIKLRYTDAGGILRELQATDSLREFVGSSSADPTAVYAFTNRVSLQWNLTGLGINTYEIAWSSLSSSMSFQKAVLDTSNTYGAGVPAGRTWTAAAGNWSTGSNWLEGTASVENGNVKFANPAAATVTLDSSRNVGELIFQTAAGVTINRPGSQKILANTGLSTTAAATGHYVVNAAWEFGSTNIFELDAGTVRFNGPVTGGYGLLKKGDGALVLGGGASFTGGVTLWGGTLRLEGANTYAGGTAVVTGRLEIAADSPLGSAGALGTSTEAVTLGADAGIFQFAGGGPASIFIDGDRAVAQSIALAAGGFEKRLGAAHTTSGANFTGAIDFGAAGNVKLTAQSATDRLTFSGAMTGGAAADTLSVDGAGTVVLSGPSAKSFAHATTVAGGTLEIASGASFTGAGAWQVNAGARLRVNGSLGGAGALVLAGGTLTGGGTVTKSLDLSSGRLAPGVHIGTLTLVGAQAWSGGGGYEWQIASAGGAPGEGADLLQITGALHVAATSSARFTIYVSTVDLGGLAGPLSDFDETAAGQWLLVTASGGISGFAASDFTIDSSGFGNAAGGEFSVGQQGDSLFLNYTPVPEPGVCALLALGGLILVFRRKNPFL